MKIEQLKVEGFRCYSQDGVTIDFERAITAFIGGNGSGKTAIFQALARLFGTSSAQRTVRKSDFHVSAEAITVVDGATLAIDCTFGFPEFDGGGDDDAVAEVFKQMCASNEGQPLKTRIRMQATWHDDMTPEGAITEEIRWVRTLTDDFVWEDYQRVLPAERAFTQLIYVPASRNATDQVSGLLKSRLWRAAQWSERFADVATDVSARLQGQFGEEEPVTFVSERLERRWREVGQGDTNARPLMRLIDSALDDLLRRAEFAFAPDLAQQWRTLEDLSDGQRSLFHIALTAAILEMECDALKQPQAEAAFDQERLKRTHLTLLAIEEPENSLSPYFLSRVMTLARSIGEMAEAQVMVSSHSASILSRAEPEEVRYTRLAAATRSSRVKPLTLPPVASDARRYVRLAVRAYPELYFAKFVILAEGDSEAIVLPRLAEAIGFPLDRSFVPIVPLGGRFVRHFWRLLSDLEIPYASLLDLDLGRKHGGAKAIKAIVDELAAVGNDLSQNVDVICGTVDPAAIDQISDQELLDEDQDHPWLSALREEAVYFSSPLDLDFAMLRLFNAEYMVPNAGGTGPRTTASALENSKKATLKDGGKTELYGSGWDDEFPWYPYLFLGESKPETHLRALAEMKNETLKADAPEELQRLLRHVKSALEL